jgi:chromosome segregation ATPase
MNAFIQKAAEFLGIATERVSQMTEHETKQLEAAGDMIGQVEAARDEAIAKVDELNAAVNGLTDTIAGLEEKISDKDAVIASLDAEIILYKKEIQELYSKVPGTDPVVPLRSESEPMPAEPQKKKKSWEIF